MSGELSEAEHCLRDLEVPHFHHELVYEVWMNISHTEIVNILNAHELKFESVNSTANVISED